MDAIKIDAERVLGPVERRLLGGSWSTADPSSTGGSSIARNGALREDTAGALREVGVPLLRWPGGNFASGYHWQDGVGPRERRPVRFDLEWQAEEPNLFGTDEYIATCQALGATPYICANAGSGTAEEAARWVEYCNRDGRSTFAALRAANGNPRPHGVPLWGIGNEVYGRGQIGRADVDGYIGTVKEFSRLMKKVDPTIRLVAVGWERAEWNFRLVKEAGEYFDYLALHSYHPRPGVLRRGDGAAPRHRGADPRDARRDRSRLVLRQGPARGADPHRHGRVEPPGMGPRALHRVAVARVRVQPREPRARRARLGARPRDAAARSRAHAGLPGRTAEGGRRRRGRHPHRRAVRGLHHPRDAAHRRAHRFRVLRAPGQRQGPPRVPRRGRRPPADGPRVPAARLPPRRRGARQLRTLRGVRALRALRRPELPGDGSACRASTPSPPSRRRRGGYASRW